MGATPLLGAAPAPARAPPSRPALLREGRTCARAQATDPGPAAALQRSRSGRFTPLRPQHGGPGRGSRSPHPAHRRALGNFRGRAAPHSPSPSKARGPAPVEMGAGATAAADAAVPGARPPAPARLHRPPPPPQQARPRAGGEGTARMRSGGAGFYPDSSVVTQARLRSAVPAVGRGEHTSRLRESGQWWDHYYACAGVLSASSHAFGVRVRDTIPCAPFQPFTRIKVFKTYEEF